MTYCGVKVNPGAHGWEARGWTGECLRRASSEEAGRVRGGQGGRNSRKSEEDGLEGQHFQE